AQRLRQARRGRRDPARAGSPRRRAGGPRSGRRREERAARPPLRRLPALQARRMGVVPRSRHGLGAREVPGRAAVVCGIAGIIYRDGADEHEVGSDMTRMLQSMKHRGPDSTGYALYRPPSVDVIMRFKLADANDPRDFEFEQRLGRSRAEVERRLRLAGAVIDEVEADTEYAYRVKLRYDGDLKRIADFVE